MKALVVTAAGMSSRFSQSVNAPTLKAIYHEGDPSKTIVNRLLSSMAGSFDLIVLVSGYKANEMHDYLVEHIEPSVLAKTIEVQNPHFEDRGSGWSLYLALRELVGRDVDYVLFSEGDLVLDGETLGKLCACHEDVITVSPDPVEASKSVALYFDLEGRPHYLYDTSHGTLRIDEPFTAVYSSGQVWGFADVPKLFDVVGSLSEEQHSKTNLMVVNGYYETCQLGALKVEKFATWINCNTVHDYRRAFCE